MYKTHQLSTTRFYRIYKSASERCNNVSNKDYSRYGNRGIKIGWATFEMFRDEMFESYKKHIEKYGEGNTTLDRINNNKGYSKENCRWATKKQQANNRRSNRFITYNGETKTVSEWADIIGVSRHTVKTRIFRGWSIEKILTPYLLK